MDRDRSPWGPAVIAAVFALLGLSALVRFPDAPGVWIVVVLAALVAGWQVRVAVLRRQEARDIDDSHGTGE